MKPPSTDDLDERYATRDLAEAAALLTRGARLHSLARRPTHFEFVFIGRAACEALSSAYWAGKMRLDPRAFSLNLRSLKDRVHAGR